MRKLLAAAAGMAALWLAAPSIGPSEAAAGSAYDFEFPSIDGAPLKLSDWRGKALLVVNTASFCGFTRQYAGLQDLWKTYEAQGLVVVGVPSNDFGDQEPQAEGDIKKFCEGAYGVTFPLTGKQKVTGDNAHPFYKWAATSIGSGGAPNWNFHKYLIGRDGRMVRSFSSQMTPASDEVRGWIEKVLAESAPASDAVQN
jgi:glutathione peroxidase